MYTSISHPPSGPKRTKQNRFQASKTVLLRCLLLWDVAQHRLVAAYRPLRTTYRPIFKNQAVQQKSVSTSKAKQSTKKSLLHCLTLYIGTHLSFRNVYNKLPPS
jgi:hypothetical protein